jgi:hypothetical protein
MNGEPMSQAQTTPQADYSRKHRQGLAHQLREIRRDISELRQDIAALVQAERLSSNFRCDTLEGRECGRSGAPRVRALGAEMLCWLFTV